MYAVALVRLNPRAASTCTTWSRKPSSWARAHGSDAGHTLYQRQAAPAGEEAQSRVSCAAAKGVAYGMAVLEDVNGNASTFSASSESHSAGSPAKEDLAEEMIAGIPMAQWLMLSKPSRYLGNEFGAVHKDWGSSRVRFCLTYPEIYEVGASNLGHILLYTVLNRQEGVLCDRAYFVDKDMAALLAFHSQPLFAVESRKPLGAFDTLGFSLSYELGGTNILEMLRMAGIPITWKERHEWEQQHSKAGAEGGGGVLGEVSAAGSKAPWRVDSGMSLPLIFAGGPTATSNPEPFADFFDFFAIGDGEDCLVEIARCLDKCKSQGLSRYDTLVALARSVPGVYVPQLYQHLPGWGAAPLPMLDGVPAKVLRRVAMPDPLDQIGLVPFTATVHDRLTVEIRRGCTRGCRFCQPGMLTRPARDVEPDRVVEAVEQGMRKTGYTEFSLLSLSCSDYLALPSVGIQIKNRLRDEPISLSLPSQRVDRFNDDIANIIGGTRKGSLTFAPEAGTQRLRDIVNKGLTDEELLRGVKAAWDKGWRQVKLYFMIGLPGETDDDVMGIARTIKWLQSNCRRGRQFLAVRLTISNFTPKPHTPFQWHSVSTEEMLRKQRMLKAALARLPGVKFSFGDVRLSAMEDFIGRGDRSIGSVIRRAWELGATNDAWWNNVEECYSCWSRAIEEAGVQWKYRKVLDGEWDVMEHLGDARYRGQGGKGRLDVGELADARLDAPLPWDVIHTGIAKWWLKADLQRALEASTVADCSHSGHCSKCGVCSDEFGDNVVAPVPDIPAYDGDFKPNRTRKQKLRVRFSKEGSMVLIGHLDLMRLFERALRRASLPVCFDNGFHSLPRISAALPLPLGQSSSCELLDVELTRTVPLPHFKSALSGQLPAEIVVQDVWEEPIFRLDGKNEDSLTKLVHAVEYLLAVQPSGQALDKAAGGRRLAGAGGGEPDEETDGVEGEEEGEGSLQSTEFRTRDLADGPGEFQSGNATAGRQLPVLPGEDASGGFQGSCQQRAAATGAAADAAAAAAGGAGGSWASGDRVLCHAASLPTQCGQQSAGSEWAEGVKGLPSFVVHSSSRRTGRAREVDVRPLLHELELLAPGSRLPPALSKTCRALASAAPLAPLLFRYVGKHSSARGSLRPEAVVQMLEEVSGQGLRLVHAHRSAILLHAPSKPKVDHALLKSIANDEAFRALYRCFDGTSKLHGTQAEDPLEAARSAQRSALASLLQAPPAASRCNS